MDKVSTHVDGEDVLLVGECGQDRIRINLWDFLLIFNCFIKRFQLIEISFRESPIDATFECEQRIVNVADDYRTTQHSNLTTIVDFRMLDTCVDVLAMLAEPVSLLRNEDFFILCWMLQIDYLAVVDAIDLQKTPVEISRLSMFARFDIQGRMTGHC